MWAKGLFQRQCFNCTFVCYISLLLVSYHTQVRYPYSGEISILRWDIHTQVRYPCSGEISMLRWDIHTQVRYPYSGEISILGWDIHTRVRYPYSGEISILRWDIQYRTLTETAHRFLTLHYKYWVCFSCYMYLKVNDAFSHDLPFTLFIWVSSIFNPRIFTSYIKLHDSAVYMWLKFFHPE